MKYNNMNHSYYLLGAIIGDISGSIYEFNNIRTTDFELKNPECHFTDDTVLTIAVADALLQGGHDFTSYVKHWGQKYVYAGYGRHFIGWLLNRDAGPYNSWGNGSAMRVSAVGYYAQSLQEAMQLAELSASITHNHPEGIKGAKATAAAIYLARIGETKEYIRDFIEGTMGYDLHRTCDAIRPTYEFNESCQGTVPEAIIAFLESTDYVNAIKLTISLGGDSDTLAAITGGIAHAYYKHIPEDIITWAMDCLPEEMKKVIIAFDEECDNRETTR